MPYQVHLSQSSKKPQRCLALRTTSGRFKNLFVPWDLSLPFIDMDSCTILHYAHTEFNVKLALATPVVLSLVYGLSLSFRNTCSAMYTQNERAGYPKVIIESQCQMLTPHWVGGSIVCKRASKRGRGRGVWWLANHLPPSAPAWFWHTIIYVDLEFPGEKVHDGYQLQYTNTLKQRVTISHAWIDCNNIQYYNQCHACVRVHECYNKYIHDCTLTVRLDCITALWWVT